MSKTHRARLERERRERHKQIVAGSKRYADCDDEPAAKKMARLNAWLYLVDWFQSDLRRQRFLVLASAEAGDVSCLLGLGVPIENICAVDLSAEAVTAARAKFPGLLVEQDDVFAVAQRWPHDVAMLDFCELMSHGLIKRLARYLGRTRVEAVCLGFMRGREPRGDRFFAEVTDSIASRRARGVPVDEQMQRENVVGAALAVETCRMGALIKTPFVLQYQTRVPMTYTWLDVERGGSVRSRWARLTREGYAPLDREFLRPLKLSEDQTRDVLARQIQKLPIKTAAMLLNLTAPRLAAWKAWATRRPIPKGLDVDGASAALVTTMEKLDQAVRAQP
jgi:hypothetical protein